MNDIALEYIANMFNARETQKEGYEIPMRWRCLRQDLKEKYLAEARISVDEWNADEIRAEQLRKPHTTG